MGWNGKLDAQSAVGAAITLTPDTAEQGRYTVSAFTAPVKGVYRFVLCASGGTNGSLDADRDGSNGTMLIPGGAGGSVTGWLLLEKGETVYVGCGGTCSAAFAARQSGGALKEISESALLFAAGAGGAGGRSYKRRDEGTATRGGDGGGEAYGAYGVGGAGEYNTADGHDIHAWGGRGGDGYRGGSGGTAAATHNSMTDFTGSYANGGGGGSSYVHADALTHMGKVYASSMQAGGGAAGGASGWVTVEYAARALLPVFFDGTQLERLVYNGTQTLGLTYNGTIIYMKRVKAWLYRQIRQFLPHGSVSARRMRSLTASA